MTFGFAAVCKRLVFARRNDVKVLLIQPPMTLLPWEIFSVTPPLGLAYIAGYLEERGHKVVILDAVVLGRERTREADGMIRIGLAWKDISAIVKRSQPDVIGVSSLFSSQVNNTYRIARIAKEYDRDVPVVVGGAHPSSVPHVVLNNHDIDYVVIGEGEHTLSELLTRLEDSQRLDDLDGLAYLENGIIRINPKRNFIQDLDDMPLPARHLLPMKLYVSGRGAELMRRPCTTMITSRGCPMRCIFCSIHSVWGWKWRGRSAEKVVDEIENLTSKFGIREIHFEDDNLTLSRKRISRICDLIMERGLDIKWTTPNGVAIWTLDRSLLEKMKRSGCYSLSFGIESGDANTLNFIGKPISLAMAKKIIATANDVGIWTHGFFVFGFPNESRESVMNTLRYAIDSDIDLASFFIATPYPGTELYEKTKREGIFIERDCYSFRTMQASMDTRYFKRKELDRLQVQLYKEFFKNRAVNYFKPRTLRQRARRFKTLDDIRFIVRLGSRFLNILKKA
jgi:magnesium-protoporphyrin IX monomethyl ester (oxidative) cyclase